MKPIVFAFFVSVFALYSCTEGPPHFATGDFLVHEVVKAPKDVKIPSALWDEIEAIPLLGSNRPAKRSDEEEEKEDHLNLGILQDLEADMRIKRLMRVTLYLKEKTEGVLGGRNHKVQFEPGGGGLDLANFVKADRGTYHVGFEVEYGDELGNLRVYFVSHSKLRDRGGEILGSGCRKYAELTSYFRRELRREGVKVNATERRDLSVLAGSYVFALPREDGLYLAQIAVYDSTMPGFHCSMSPVHLP